MAIAHRLEAFIPASSPPIGLLFAIRFSIKSFVASTQSDRPAQPALEQNEHIARKFFDVIIVQMENNGVQ